MRQWHVEHMEKTVLKYVKGLSADASTWEKRNHKKYGSLQNTCRQIEYDFKHGVSHEELFATVSKLRSGSSFRALRKDSGSMERLSDIEKYFIAATKVVVVPSRW